MAGPLGWRAAFLLEAAAMLPFLAFCAFAPALDLRGAGGTTPLGKTLHSLQHLLKHCAAGRSLRRGV